MLYYSITDGEWHKKRVTKKNNKVPQPHYQISTEWSEPVYLLVSDMPKIYHGAHPLAVNYKQRLIDKQFGDTEEKQIEAPEWYDVDVPPCQGCKAFRKSCARADGMCKRYKTWFACAWRQVQRELGARE